MEMRGVKNSLRRSLRAEPSESKMNRFDKKFWDAMTWKHVDTSRQNMGLYDDVMLLDFEELDGSEFNNLVKHGNDEMSDVTGELKTKESSETIDQSSKTEKSEKSKKEKKTKKEKKPVKGECVTNNSIEKVNYDYSDAQSIVHWGNQVALQPNVCEALNKLNFLTPTPIQNQAIPTILRGDCDVVGIAETGSGKTLSFLLPVIQFIVSSYSFQGTLSLQSLILTPTRELALQIHSVFREVASALSPKYQLHAAAVVGGFSEQKQKRLLDISIKPLHVLIATPGRFCDLMTECDQELPFVPVESRTHHVLADMSHIRYLIIDEVDRMVEDGHFMEVRILMISNNYSCVKERFLFIIVSFYYDAVFLVDTHTSSHSSS